MIASPMYLENVDSESSQLHKSGSSCKKSIRTSRLGASCLMTTQKAMPLRAGALGLPGKYSTRCGADFTEFGSISIRIEAVPGSHLVIDRVFQRRLQSEKEALIEENQSRV